MKDSMCLTILFGATMLACCGYSPDSQQPPPNEKMEINRALRLVETLHYRALDSARTQGLGFGYAGVLTDSSGRGFRHEPSMGKWEVFKESGVENYAHQVIAFAVADPGSSPDAVVEIEGVSIGLVVDATDVNTDAIQIDSSVVLSKLLSDLSDAPE